MQDFPTVQKALREIQESLDAATQSRAMPKVYTSDFPLVAGNFHRVTAPSGRTVNAKLPAASGANLSESVTLHLEGMQGAVKLWAAPGQTANGEETATFDTDGVVVLWSNGVDAWTSVAQLPAESPGGAALDAEYVLGDSHASLPNGRVATASTEITPGLGTANVITWALNTASVAFGKLANLTGLSVLGRAANSTGAMAAIAASSARQVLRANDAGTQLEWGHPVEVRDSGADQGDAFALDFVAGTNVDLAASVAAGVATITPSVDLSSVTYTAGDGIDLAGNQFSADVSDFAGAGLEDDGSNNLRLASIGANSILGNFSGSPAVPSATTISADSIPARLGGNLVSYALSSLAGDGFGYASGAINVGAGDGIDVSASAVSVDASDLVGDGLGDDGSNNLRVKAGNFISVTSVLGVSWAGTPVQENGTPVLVTGATTPNYINGDNITMDVVSTGGGVYTVQANWSGFTVKDNGSNVSTATKALDFLAGGQVAWTLIEAPTGEVNVQGNFAPITAHAYLGNPSGSSAAPTAQNYATLAGEGLDYDLAGGLDVRTADAHHIFTDDNSQVAFRKSRRRNFWFEDFECHDGASPLAAGSSALKHYGQTSWCVQPLGASGVTTTFQTATDNHPGILSFITVATSTRGILMYRGDNNDPTKGTTFASEVFSHTWIVRLADPTNVLMQIGLSDSPASTSPNNSVRFVFDTNSDTTIHAVTSEGGSTNDQDTNTAPGNGWNVYTIMQETAGVFDFYIDDVLEATANSNTPDSEQVTPFLYFLNRAAASRQIDIDYCDFESQDLGARTS